MTGTSEDHASDERCIGMLMATSGGLQVYMHIGRDRDRKLALRSETYFQCSSVNAAADASMSVVTMVSAF